LGNRQWMTASLLKTCRTLAIQLVTNCQSA
jgi:hypothetical protein